MVQGTPLETSSPSGLIARLATPPPVSAPHRFFLALQNHD